MSTPPPLLLVSGWGASGRSWERFLPYVDGWEVMAPDNRETGNAGAFPEGFTLEDLAADALAAVDRAGHERVTVVGHSMGGMIAQALAFLAPQRVERLILVSTGPGSSRSLPTDPSVLVLPPGIDLPSDPTQLEIAFRAAIYEKLMSPRTDPSAAEIAREEAERAQGNSADLEGLMRQFQAISSWDPPGELKSLELDVTVVHGDADILVSYGNGQIVAERAGVPLLTLGGVNHMVPWEAPEALAEVINAGLASG